MRASCRSGTSFHPDASWFFFSSRRRHTRSKRDWSSDVCSSDLGWCAEQIEVAGAIELPEDEEVGEALDVGEAEREFGQDVEHAFGVVFGVETLGDFGAFLVRAGDKSEERRVGKECRSWWWADVW